jgi:hypothetical protein
MTAPAKARVETHSDYQEAHASSDVFLLMKIVKSTHLVNLEAEAMRLETALQHMRMGNDDFTTYSSQFHDLVVSLQSVGSNMTTERVVFLFLVSLPQSKARLIGGSMTLGSLTIRRPSKWRGIVCTSLGSTRPAPRCSSSSRDILPSAGRSQQVPLL